jgi:hypothetical protein
MDPIKVRIELVYWQQQSFACLPSLLNFPFILARVEGRGTQAELAGNGFP